VLEYSSNAGRIATPEEVTTCFSFVVDFLTLEYGTVRLS
jgi:hypothetical protein